MVLRLPKRPEIWIVLIYVLISFIKPGLSEVYAGPYDNRAFWSKSATATCPSTGLIGAYNFNEGSGATTADLSTQNNYLDFLNHLWTTSGHTSNTVVWDGTSTWGRSVSPSGDTLTTSVTVMAWVYPTIDPGSGEHMIISLNSGGGADYPFGLESFDYVQATGQPTCYRESGGSYVQPALASKLALNTWTHIACTYDNSNIKIYVNGTLVKTQAATGTLNTGIPFYGIGFDPGSGEYFGGRLDDVRIYSTALSASEVGACMGTAVQ